MYVLHKIWKMKIKIGKIRCKVKVWNKFENMCKSQ